LEIFGDVLYWPDAIPVTQQQFQSTEWFHLFQ